MLIQFAAFVVIGYLIKLLWRRRLTLENDRAYGKTHGCLPPPLLINGLPFGIDRLEQIFRANRELRLMELFLFHFRRTGWTLQQVFLGTQAFGTVDPENLEAILSTDFKDYGYGPRRDIAFPLFGDGIFTQDGAPWKSSREMLRPQFHHKQYSDLAVFQPHVDDLIACITRNLADCPTVDLQPLFFQLTLDTTTAFLFGESVESLRSSERTEQTFADAFNLAQDYIARRFRLLDIYWLIGGSRFYKACSTVHRFTDQILDRNLSNHSALKKDRQARYVFLDVVHSRSSNRTELRSQMINILAAGRDTTACLLSWTFYLLVRHEAVFRKLRSEISTTLGQRSDLTRADLKDLQYLNSVLKECLRLFPPFPVNTRTAAKTTVLPTGGGPDRNAPVLIRKGQAVAFSVYSLHRRPDLFGDDAEEFRPERWEEALPMNNTETRKTWSYLPFSGGPRICLGMDFALTEAAYTIVRLLQAFPSINKLDTEPSARIGKEKQQMTVTLAPGGGCKVNIGI